MEKNQKSGYLTQPGNSKEDVPQGLDRFEKDKYDDLSNYRQQLIDDGKIDENGRQLADLDNKEMEKLDKFNELDEKKRKKEEYDAAKQQEPQGSPTVRQAMENLGPEGNENKETLRSLWENDKEAMKDRWSNRVDSVKSSAGNAWKSVSTREGRKELGRKAGVGAYKTIKGVAHAAPRAMYKAARGTLKTATRLGAAATMGALGLAIGATTGDGEQALSMMGAAAGAGFALGDNVFDATAGRVLKDNRTVRESYGAAKYGSAQDYRNKKADDAYIKSQEHKDLYEQYFKTGENRMTKQEYDKAVRSYRESGITDNDKITKALKLENKYKKDHATHGSDEQIRRKVQNVAALYDGVSRKAVTGEDKNAREAALQNFEAQMTNVKDPKQKRDVANDIMQTCIDWYRM